jgi:hypothetical protein
MDHEDKARAVRNAVAHLGDDLLALHRDNPGMARAFADSLIEEAIRLDRVLWARENPSALIYEGRWVMGRG